MTPLYFPITRPLPTGGLTGNEFSFMRAVAPPGLPRIPSFRAPLHAFQAVERTLTAPEAVRYVICDELVFPVARPEDNHIAGIFEGSPEVLCALIGSCIVDVCEYDAEAGVISVLTSLRVSRD